MTQSTGTGQQSAEKKATAMEFAIAAAELAYSTRCVDVIVLDLRGRSPVTEFFVIGTGSSPRQMRTAVEEMQDLGKKMGFAAWKTSGLESSNWILLDCVNVVCHLFDTDGRDFYDLELLWGDCPRVDWRKELGLPPAPEPRPMEEVEFSEKSRLDQIDAEEEEERELTELEGDEEADEDSDGEPPVVVELPDESTGPAAVELVEIDPPSKRGRREHALYPTKIAEQTNSEEEAAMHVLRTSEAAEAIDEEEEPVRKRAVKKAVRSAVKKAAKKKPTKAAARKAPAKKKAAVKKKPAAKPKKKVAAKKPAKKKPAKKKR